MEETIGNYKLIYDGILTQEQKLSVIRQLDTERRVQRLAGTCTGTITVAAPYRESVLQSCIVDKLSAIPGETFSITATIAVGSTIEDYKLILTGDMLIESNIVSIIGADPVQNIDYIFNLIVPTDATIGTKNYTATLQKVII